MKREGFNVIVSEHKCVINNRDSLAVAKFNDLYFFEFNVDDNVGQIVLDEKHFIEFINNLEEMRK